VSPETLPADEAGSVAALRERHPLGSSNLAHDRAHVQGTKDHG
jgi:hypothetical protein